MVLILLTCVTSCVTTKPNSSITKYGWTAPNFHPGWYGYYGHTVLIQIKTWKGWILMVHGLNSIEFNFRTFDWMIMRLIDLQISLKRKRQMYKCYDPRPWKPWPNGLASSRKYLQVELAYRLVLGGQTSLQISSQVNETSKHHFKVVLCCNSLTNRKLLDISQLALTWVGWPNGEKPTVASKYGGFKGTYTFLSLFFHLRLSCYFFAT